MAESVLTYRSQHSRLWVAVGAVATIAVAGAYGWAWTQSLDRPWFPLMALATVVVGGVFVVAFLRRWHTIEVLPEPARLRARGVLGSETFDIADATLARHEVAVAGWMHNVDAALSDRRRTPPVRSELVVETSGRSLVIQARGHRRAALAKFATQLGELLHTEVAERVSPITRTSAVRPTDTARPTVYLDGGVSTQGPAQRVGRVVVMAVGGLVLLGVPLALVGPQYEAEVLDSPRREVDKLSSLLTSHRVGLQNDVESVTVSAHWRTCRRQNAWLWGAGDDDGVASLELVARTAVDPADRDDVARHLDEVLKRRSGEMGTEWREPKTSQTVRLTDDGLELSHRHGCLREEHHEQAEARLSVRIASWLSWLASPPGRA